MIFTLISHFPFSFAVNVALSFSFPTWTEKKIVCHSDDVLNRAHAHTQFCEFRKVKGNCVNPRQSPSHTRSRTHIVCAIISSWGQNRPHTARTRDTLNISTASDWLEANESNDRFSDSAFEPKKNSLMVFFLHHHHHRVCMCSLSWFAWARTFSFQIIGK